MIPYLIIDDEPIAHKVIENYCSNLSYLEKAGNCYNAKEAMQSLYNNKVDVIFLDINMPEISGFEFLKSLTNPPKVIVTSAYQEYAIEGFELEVCDYLLKPFSLQRFMRAINKVSELLKAKPSALNSNQGDKGEIRQIFLKGKGENKYYQIEESNILFVEAAGNYCKVVLNDQEIQILQKLSELNEILPNDRFIQVHRSFIVSNQKIESIEGNQIRISDFTIPIGKTYKDNIRKLMNS